MARPADRPRGDPPQHQALPKPDARGEASRCRRRHRGRQLPRAAPTRQASVPPARSRRLDRETAEPDLSPALAVLERPGWPARSARRPAATAKPCSTIACRACSSISNLRGAPRTAPASPGPKRLTGPAQGDIIKLRSAATSRGDRMIVARDQVLLESLTGCVELRRDGALPGRTSRSTAPRPPRKQNRKQTTTGIASRVRRIIGSVLLRNPASSYVFVSGQPASAGVENDASRELAIDAIRFSKASGDDQSLPPIGSLSNAASRAASEVVRKI